MKTKIIAHRGHTKNHPENTLAAFQAALRGGADAIELDVHLTSDGELVVHHDYYLGDPDNGEGVIYERDIAYIRSLTVKGTESIPSLEEVFQLIGKKLHYEIELKGFTEDFLIRVVFLVKQYDLVDRIEFTSPHSYILTRLKVLEPTFTTGMFVAPFPSWMDTKLGLKLIINNALLGNIAVLHLPLDIINKPFIQTAHENKLLVHVADCNTEKSIRAAFRMNVDQFSTDELDLAITVNRSTSDVTRDS